MAAEHACLPLAPGHGGLTAAAAQGGEIPSSPRPHGAHPHHQACGVQCWRYTLKMRLCFHVCVFDHMYIVLIGWFTLNVLHVVSTVQFYFSCLNKVGFLFAPVHSKWIAQLWIFAPITWIGCKAVCRLFHRQWSCLIFTLMTDYPKRPASGLIGI